MEIAPEKMVGVPDWLLLLPPLKRQRPTHLFGFKPNNKHFKSALENRMLLWCARPRLRGRSTPSNVKHVQRFWEVSSPLDNEILVRC